MAPPPDDDASRAPASSALPVASLTLAARPRPISTSASATAGWHSSSGARAVRAVPALRASPTPLVLAADGTSRRSAPAAAAATRQDPVHQQQQQQQRGGFRPWRLPLAAAGLLLHVAGAAAKQVFTPGGAQPRQQHTHTLGDSRVFPSLLPRRLGGAGGSPPGLPGGRKPALVWFRNDLRLHDHEPLAAACAGSTSVLPVYVFDPREYGKSPTGFDKTGPYRARFILEALSDLRARLRDAGSDLVLRIGRPEDVLPQLCRAVGAGAVYCHGEVTAEEGGVEAAVARALDKAGAALKVMWGGTLFHVEDLPFQLTAMPPHYSEFRKAVRPLAVRAPVAAPASVKALPAASVSPGDLPSLQQLGFDPATLQRCCSRDTSAGGANLRGGESEALRRLSDFISHFSQPPRMAPAAAAAAPASGSGSSSSSPAGSNFCCKISPWLALGCLSPRQLYDQLQQRLAAQRQQAKAAGEGADADMQWLLYELLWRDFFRFITKKHALAGLTGAHARTGAAATATAAPAMAVA